MTCPRLSEESYGLLLDYSAGKLDAGRKAALEAHMRACAGCEAFAVEQAALWNALDVWEPEPVSLHFNRRLWQRIDAILPEPWRRQLRAALRFGAWKPAFPLAAVAFVVVAGFLFDHRERRAVSPRASNAVAVTSAEAEQAEKTLDDLQLLKALDAAGS